MGKIISINVNFFLSSPNVSKANSEFPVNALKIVMGQSFTLSLYLVCRILLSALLH